MTRCGRDPIAFCPVTVFARLLVVSMMGAPGLFSLRTVTATPTVTTTPFPTATVTRWPTHTARPTDTRAPTATATPLYCPEPENDTRAGACGPLMPGMTYQGYIAPVDDDDWFYFDVASLHAINARLGNIAEGCDYELYLTDFRGDLIEYSATRGSVDELIGTEPLAPGRYYLLVFGAFETWSDRQPYALRVDYGAPGPTLRVHLPVIAKAPYWCPEPVNDTRDGACGPLQPGVVYHEFISSASDRFDWFYFDLPIAGSVEAWLTDIPDARDYELYLKDDQGVTLEYSAERGNQDEHVGPVGMAAGPGYLVVLPANDGGWSEGAPYALRLEYAADAGMVYVPGGEFLMGSSDADPDGLPQEKPQHPVYVDSFYIGRTEVTNTQYRRFVEAGGYSRREYWTAEGWQWKEEQQVAQPGSWRYSSFAGPEQPVTDVSWYEADAYARWYGGRLPTEAEWEYAARGGPLSQNFTYSGGNDVNEVSWDWNNSFMVTHPVGEKLPNELGLHDMTGNAAEWCEDWYDSGYYAVSPYRNPHGPASGEYRVVRGESFLGLPLFERCVFRCGREPVRCWDCGFRVVLPAP